MADLIKALEADLFGSHEWAADLYADLADAPDPVARLVVRQGLFRAVEALEDRDGSEAAARMAEAEAEVPSALAAAMAPLDAARERLLEAEEPAAQASRLAPEYLTAFRAAWERGPRMNLVADALLAALVEANLLGGRKRPSPGEPRAEFEAHLRRAADLYAAVAALLEPRVAAGEAFWRDTARSAWHHAMVAWRLAGEEGKARGAEESARGLGAGAGTFR